MPDMISRIEEIAEKYKKDFPRDEKRFNDCGDDTIMSKHRFLAVADYIKTKDPQIFFYHFSKVGEYQLKLFEMAAEKGDVSSDSVSIYRLPKLMTILAGGHWRLFKSLAPYLEKIPLKGNPFIRRFFRVLRDFACDGLQDLPEAVDDLEHFLRSHDKSYYGYALAFKAIVNQDTKAFQEAFDVIMKGHRVLCRRGAEFGDSVDEVIAIWPLAVVNLARFKGLDIHVDDPLVPRELVTSQLGEE